MNISSMEVQDGYIFEYTYSDMFAYADMLARSMNASIDGDEIIFPEHIAKGYARFFQINEFISYQVMHYIPQVRMLFRRNPTAERHILIAFRNFSLVKNGKKATSFSPDLGVNKCSLGSIQCKSSQLPEQIIIEPGFEVKVIMVLLKEGWIQNILRDTASKEKFTRYLLNQSSSLHLHKGYLDPSQRKLFNNIFKGNSCFLKPHLFYDSRVVHLLEKFMKEILAKEDAESPYLFASYEDIKMLQKAEQFINQNLTKPFPGVEVLSRISCMCRTKFINLFQKVYGVSSYEYSQKKRLAIAYEYLRSGKYSVYDTAQIIGYAGANNFAAAFKKEFGLLPSELLEKLKESEQV